MYVKKITLSLFILCVAFVGAAQQKRKVKYVDISHSNSKETTHTFLDSNGRKISVKQTIFDGFNSIVTYTPTGKKKTTEMNFDGTRDLWTNFYDAHDNLTRLEYYNFINNTRFVASSYTYDNKNRQLTRAEYDGRGQLQNLKTTVYDDVKNTDTSVWSYNLLHQKSISKFDHKGNEVFRELYEGNDTVAYTTFKYDEKNRQIEKK
ncbi:hypothetical protein [Mucilaginibacter flavidus]|uniref:hypothetical protein n=1 Tax=Mucilaginibacter flavidus TaxID=2949309 RepID=UPI0020928E1A|nr:hypothetical protein [Mucilaginibacter flavidus]MCO5951103.1 hypothetical protein [Mucilaginibacter flavidus]